MHARIVVIDIEIFFALRTLRSNGVQEQCELGIRHLGAIDEKLGNFDAMLRPFVFRPVIAAHQEHAGGNADHFAEVVRRRNHSGAGKSHDRQ